MSQKLTPELKAAIIEDYLASDPTPENSPEIVAEIAENHGVSPNGVRIVLTQENVYLKKVAVKTTENKEGTPSTGTKRVSKEAAITELKSILTERGAELDADILDKLTGKAAVYFASVIKGL